jgi:hypothetical protein
VDADDKDDEDNDDDDDVDDDDDDDNNDDDDDDDAFDSGFFSYSPPLYLPRRNIKSALRIVLSFVLLERI